METDRLSALADSWLERSDHYVEQAKRLDAEDKPLEALRLGTYALMWNLAAKQLTETLCEIRLAELPPEMQEVLGERHLRSVN